jgi:hypothetical protein
MAPHDNLILVTGPDVAAAGAEIGAGPAITPTAAAGALRTMRWPLRVFESSKGIGIRSPET